MAGTAAAAGSWAAAAPAWASAGAGTTAAGRSRTTAGAEGAATSSRPPRPPRHRPLLPPPSPLSQIALLDAKLSAPADPHVGRAIERVDSEADDEGREGERREMAVKVFVRLSLFTLQHSLSLSVCPRSSFALSASRCLRLSACPRPPAEREIRFHLPERRRGTRSLNKCRPRRRRSRGRFSFVVSLSGALPSADTWSLSPSLEQSEADLLG